MTNDARDEFGDVDDVLGDLDRALSVEPSPAVTARVRRAIEAAMPSGSNGTVEIPAGFSTTTTCGST